MRNSTLQLIQAKVRTPEMRRTEMRRFAKFATVGALGFLTHFTIVNLLVQLAGWAETTANPVGFVTAVVQNFLLNRRFTFPESRERHAGRQLSQFFLVSVIGLGLNQLVFWVADSLLEGPMRLLIANERLAHAVSYNLALCIAVGVVLFWNFAANRMWTYRGLSTGAAGAADGPGVEGAPDHAG